MTQPEARPARRTQAERRAATRAALLDATVDGLVRHGYAHLTTAQIAEAAGVTRGALAHHFPGKSELVVEAVLHLGGRLGAEFLERVAADPRTASDRPLAERSVALLDQVWATYSSLEFTAILELWVAARTDDELRTSLRAFESEGVALVTDAARVACAEAADVRGFAGLITTTTSTVRGLALAASVRPVDTEWPTARRHLATLWQIVLGPEES